MRFHRPLDALFRRPSTIKVLRLLVRFPAKEFTGRELARLAEVSPPQGLRCLDDLLRSGMVRGRSAGRARLWSFRSEHYFAPALTTLFALDEAALFELQRTLEKGLRGLPIRGASIYGSVARGVERPESDIDLLIRTDSRNARRLPQALVPLTQVISLRFGNTLSPLVVKPGRGASPAVRQILAAASVEGLRLWGGGSHA